MKNINKVIFPLILLALLLLAGCDNQKAIDKAIAEEEQRVVDFLDTYDKVCSCTFIQIHNEHFYGTWDLSDYIDGREGIEKNGELNSIMAFLCIYLGDDGHTSIPSHEGTLEIGKKADGTVYINATGIKITCVDDDKENPLSLDCYMTKKVTSDETDGSVFTEYKVSSLEINGKEYKPIQAKINSNGKKSEFTLALVEEDNHSASIEILNAMDYASNKW